MGKRSGVPDSEEEVSKLTAEELDAEIKRRKLRLKFAGTSLLRKAFEKRIHRLERNRARKYG